MLCSFIGKIERLVKHLGLRPAEAMAREEKHKEHCDHQKGHKYSG